MHRYIFVMFCNSTCTHDTGASTPVSVCNTMKYIQGHVPVSAPILYWESKSTIDVNIFVCTITNKYD